MVHLLTTLLLGPVLLAQGKYVRRTIEMLPEPTGAREGSCGQGDSLRLLIVGDSAGAGVGAETQDTALLGALVSALGKEYQLEYRLVATTGHKTSDSLAELDAMEPERFDIVVTSLGVNDVTSGTSLSAFRKRQCALITLLRNKFSVSQIILSGLPPVSDFPALPQPLRWYLGARAQRFDLELRRISRELGTDYIEFEFDGDTSVMASDGFHPGPEVYKTWAGLIADVVARRKSVAST